MFCNKCGQEIKGNINFCSNCGARVDGTEVQQSRINIKADEIIGRIIAMPRKSIITILIILCLIITVSALAHKKANTIDLNKYVEISFEGYNGYGQADISFDWNRLELDYGEKLEELDILSYSQAYQAYTSSEVLLDYIYIDMDSDSGLSNGDTINYRWHVNPKLKHVKGLEFKYKDGTEKVSGLEEADMVDVFDELTVDYIGISPLAGVTLNYTGEYFDVSDFSCDKEKYVADGETITVTFNRDINDIAKEYGMVIAKTTNTYTVKCSKKYAEKIDEINDDVKNRLKAQADDVVKAFTSAKEDYYSYTSFDYIGDYLISAKSFDTYCQNRYGMVYKLTLLISDSAGSASYDLYFDVVYIDVDVDKEGNSDIDVVNYIIPSGYEDGIAHIEHSYYSYTPDAFDSLTSLKSFRIDSQADLFNYEWNVTEQ